MTKKDSRKYVLRVLAETLRFDFDNGSVWLEQHPDDGTPLSDADQIRVRREAETIMSDLRAKGAKQ